MKFLKCISWVALIIISGSCNRPTTYSATDSLIVKENELLKRELELKQQELELQKGYATANKQDVPVSEIYKKVKRGVFMVYVSGNEAGAIGSGFFLNKEGIAISNYHVFENANSGIVILDNGTKEMITRILTFSKEMDYVIFKVGLGDENDFHPLDIASSLPDIGELCFAIGNPNGFSQTLSIGNISGYRIYNNQHLIQTTAEITHGSSGGPLFNSHGEVIGITTMGFNQANLNFAIDINSTSFSSYLNASSPAPVLINNIPSNQVKDLIVSYYECVSKKEYSRLSDFYAPVLERYFTEFNIPAEKAVENASSYLDRYKILHADVLIRWETFKVQHLEDGNTMVSFNMDYVLQRVQVNKATKFNLNINILLNPDMKIRSIFEDIISKG